MNTFLSAIVEISDIYKKSESGEYENNGNYMDDMERLKLLILDIEDILINKHGRYFDDFDQRFP
jgi:hypothetical protein